MDRYPDDGCHGSFPSGRDALIRNELDRILHSATFASSSRLRALLTFAVEKALSQHQEQLKESILGVEVYRRKAGYDVKTDSIVRVEAHRMRGKLEQYYTSEGRGDAIRIEFPKGGYVPVFSGRDEAKPTARRSLASLVILPFDPLGGDSADQHFSEGLTEELISALAAVPGLRVIARTSAFAIKGKHKDLRRIGEELKVRAALQGSIRRLGSRVRINATLLQTADGCCLWSRQFEREVSDTLAIQEEIARAITGILATELRTRLEFSRKYTEDVEARDLYLKGRYWWHRWGPDNAHRAAQFFQDAIRRDPLFAAAYAGLADCYFLRGYWGPEPSSDMHKARAAAIQALEIDDSLAEAHCSLGLIENAHMWNSTRCREELERSLELKPGYALARSKYGTSYLTPLGRVAEARVWIEKALELDPLSPQINLDMALNLLYSGDAQRAVEQCHRTIELDRRFLRAYWVLGLAYGETASWREAVQAQEKALQISPNDLTSLIGMTVLLARSGDTIRAKAVESRLYSLAGSRLRAIGLALIAASFGQADEAFHHLESAITLRDPHLRLLKIHPVLRLLGDDPRYAELIGRVGLPS